MSERADESVSADAPPMSVTDHQIPQEQQLGVQDNHQTPQERPEPTIGSVQISIWPPSQRTRDAVVKRLIETLSNPSVLSKRYGPMSPDDAASAARVIEQDAFSAFSSAASNSHSVDEGIEILQGYSKVISRRMLESLKSRSAPPADASPTDLSSSPSYPPSSASVAADEEPSSVETES